eukprot:6336978-Amphidinium_carterae.1
MASTSANAPLDPNMVDDPPAEHSERYAGTPSPGRGLTPRSEQVMSPNQRGQQIVRERSQSHEGGTPRRSASKIPGTPPPPLAEDQFHDLPTGPALVPSTPTECVSKEFQKPTFGVPKAYVWSSKSLRLEFHRPTL